MTISSRVHITPHMHWDREWYFTTEESRILLVNNMEEIMLRLESDPTYPFFVLDGQTSILEDYFAVKSENKARFKALVQAGKLIIGPWYTQTDTMSVAGESILRNLLYGLRDCREFGEPMRIGYLPDSFGMSSQLPHIFNGFGFKDAMFWRGCSERHGTDKTEFRWESNDESSVNVQILPLGYAIGKYLPNDELALKKRLDQYLNVLEKASLTQDILLPNGHDQMPIQQDIFEVIEKLKKIYPEREFLMSRFEDVFARIAQISPQLATLKGEFNDGKYMRVHRTISSTRMDIKIAHAKIENKIVNILEPLAALAWSLGFEYHHGLLEKMWKEILKNHAHDSIGCCCSDKVHAEIMNRFILADDMAENLIQFYMRKIVDHIQDHAQLDIENKDNKLTFFNLMPYARTEIINTKVLIRASGFDLFDEHNQLVKYSILAQQEVDPGLIDRQIVHYGNYDPFMEYQIQLEYTIPAMGYCTFNIIPTIEKDADKNNKESNQKKSSKNVLENNFYHININANGTLDILDKQTGKEYHQVLELEDGSDDGDEYDYSPLLEDWVIYTAESNYKAADINVILKPLQSVASINYTLDIPADLIERKKRQAHTKMSVKFTITLTHNSPRIDVHLQINNQARDHRVRVLIPTQLKTQEVVADNHFGCITRPIKDDAMQNWEANGWKEAPIPVWQLMNFVALNEVIDQNPSNNAGCAVFTQGLREFEIITRPHAENTIALTVFRSVGFLGKENMVLRPGRPSGIKLPTPDSQMCGDFECNFSLMAYKGDHISARIMQAAREYVTPIQTYNKIPFNAMKLNANLIKTLPSYSLLSQVDNAAVISVLKKAEDSQALILRVYNPSETELIQDNGIQFKQTISQCVNTDMNEDVLAHQDQNLIDQTQIDQTLKNTLNFGIIKPCQSKTFKIILKN